MMTEYMALSVLSHHDATVYLVVTSNRNYVMLAAMDVGCGFNIICIDMGNYLEGQ